MKQGSGWGSGRRDGGVSWRGPPEYTDIRACSSHAPLRNLLPSSGTVAWSAISVRDPLNRQENPNAPL